MRIKSIEWGQDEHTWDIEVEDVHEYSVAGVVCHNSSQLLGETNGIEPPRAPIVTKSSKTGILKQVVPQYTKLKNQYDYVWDQKSPLGYLALVGVMQKWVDQSISSNTSYNPNHYPDGKFPMSVLIRDMMYANNIGVKTLYYFNTNDTKEDASEVIEKVSDNDCCVI